MKNLLVALFVAVIAPLHARILTVSNSPLNPGQYSSVTMAMGFAFIGDTIYVHGSTINYGTIDVFVPELVVIGTGHTPQKQFPFVATFTDIQVHGPNVQLIGLIAETVTVHQPNFTMKRCKILGSPFNPGLSMVSFAPGTSLIESNYFVNDFFQNTRITEAPGDNITIRNNIFSGVVDFQLGGTPSLLLIANNIFFKGPQAFIQIDHATINNNIFYGSAPVLPFLSTITTNNNITFQCIDNFFAPGPFMTHTNNLEGVDPQFVNYPGGGAVFSFLHDYNLAAGSPGLGNGSDGTDRGVYGGFGTIFNMTGEPAIAEISSVTITSPTTVPPGGFLDVTVVSRRVH